MWFNRTEERENKPPPRHFLSFISDTTTSSPAMSLIYAVVANGATVLTEHTNSNGNFGQGKQI